MPDTLAKLADDCCAAIEAYGGAAQLHADIEADDPYALALIAAVDVRADRLGATAADVIAAIRTAASRHGIPVATIH